MAVVCSECEHQNPDKTQVCQRCKYPFGGEWPPLVSRTAGNYKLVRRVGGGGFGAVYEARHITLGKSFAVKILDPRMAKQEHLIERFQQEALVMAELRHENVVQVLDSGFAEDVGFYLITEWLEGRSLFKIWRHAQMLEPGWILAIYSQLLDALEFAHARGIVHRDLKPENIMLTTGGRSRILLKIVDFGIAKMVGQSFEARSNDDKGSKDLLNKKGVVVGTPYYMAPEQIRGQMDKIDLRTDLYACGIMLGEMLTGQRVFEGGSYEGTMRLHLEAHPPSLHDLCPEREFPPLLEETFARALSKERETRFQSAQEFYGFLAEGMKQLEVEPIWEDIYSELNIKQKPPERPQRPPLKYQKLDGVERSWSKELALGIGSGLLVLAILTALLLSFLPQKTIPTPDAGPKKRRTAVWIVPETRPEPEPPPPERKNVPETIVPKDTPTKKIVRVRAPKISISLDSKPSGAFVWINGRKRGKTPLKWKARVGQTLRVEIRKKGYIKHKFRWKVRKNNRTKTSKLIEEFPI